MIPASTAPVVTSLTISSSSRSWPSSLALMAGRISGPDAVLAINARLATLLDRTRREGEAAGLRAAAEAVRGLRVHVDNDPRSTCPDGCGWFNYAADKIASLPRADRIEACS